MRPGLRGLRRRPVFRLEPRARRARPAPPRAPWSGAGCRASSGSPCHCAIPDPPRALPCRASTPAALESRARPGGRPEPAPWGSPVPRSPRPPDREPRSALAIRRAERILSACSTCRPEPSPSLHRHRGLDAAARGGGRAVRGRAGRSSPPACGPRSGRTAGSRWTRPGMRSSSRSGAPTMRWPRRQPPRRRSPDRIAGAYGDSHWASRWSARPDTSGWTCRAARVMSAGHGGQVLVSESTRVLLDDRFELADLGEHRLKDLSAPQRLYQVGSTEFPPSRHCTGRTCRSSRRRSWGERASWRRPSSLRDNRLITPSGRAARGRHGLRSNWPPRRQRSSPTACSGSRFRPSGPGARLADDRAGGRGAEGAGRVPRRKEHPAAPRQPRADPRRRSDRDGPAVRDDRREGARDEPRAAARRRRAAVRRRAPTGGGRRHAVRRARPRRRRGVRASPAVAAICRRLDGLPLALELRRRGSACSVRTSSSGSSGAPAPDRRCARCAGGGDVACHYRVEPPAAERGGATAVRGARRLRE